jgi:hypothetical protein
MAKATMVGSGIDEVVSAAGAQQHSMARQVVDGDSSNGGLGAVADRWGGRRRLCVRHTTEKAGVAV